jgi:hypothetical protein
VGLYALPAALIDRLPPEAKRLPQSVVVTGTEVPLHVLQAIIALPEATLYRSLAHVQVGKFLYERRLFVDDE